MVSFFLRSFFFFHSHAACLRRCLHFLLRCRCLRARMPQPGGHAIESAATRPHGSPRPSGSDPAVLAPLTAAMAVRAWLGAAAARARARQWRPRLGPQAAPRVPAPSSHGTKSDIQRSPQRASVAARQGGSRILL
jgi:hypothetical protein